jgi:hypothetical protein
MLSNFRVYIYIKFDNINIVIILKSTHLVMKWLTQRLFLTFILWRGVLEGGVVRHHSVTSLPLWLEHKNYTHNELSYMI